MPDQIKTGEGTTIDVLPWSEDVLHPGKVAFDPAIYSGAMPPTGFPTDFMGVPGAWKPNSGTVNSSSSSYYFQRFEPFCNRSSSSWVRGWPALTDTVATRAQDWDEALAPGAWVRLTFNWDYADISKGPDQRLGISYPTAINTNWESLVEGKPVLKQNDYSYNDQDLLSFGEIPTWVPLKGNLFNHFRQTPEVEGHTFFPARRLDSLIDNIDMRFGATLGPAGQAPAWRYNVRTTYEPQLVLNPRLPIGAKLLAVSGRMFDVS